MLRSFRLGSGLVLLTYIATHLANHVLGLASLSHAEAVLGAAIAVWHSWPGTVALYGAAALHFALALTTIFLRRNWRLPPAEILRLWSGFSLPPLLIGHAVGTRLGVVLHGADVSYAKTVSGLIASGSAGWQLALLAPGWVHGCLGLWISLRRIPAIARYRNALLVFVVGLPLLAAAGFGQMVREVRSNAPAPVSPPSPEAIARLMSWKSGLETGYFVLLIGAIALGQARYALLRRRPTIGAGRDDE